MRLYAAILSEPTWRPKSIFLNGLGRGKKEMERLQKYVADSWLKITEMQQAHPVVDWQAVFLAPEYFFSNRRDAKDRFFSHDVKRYILQGLAALSKQYPNLLMVPGTILWTKDIWDSTTSGKKYFNPRRLDDARNRSIQANSAFGTTRKKEGWDRVGNIQAQDAKIAQNVAYVCLGT